MSENVKAYSSKNMASEALKEKHLVLVDFWAPWCGPCRMLAPVFEQLAGEYTAVEFAKLNIDENMDTAIGLGIASIPTMMLFKDGVLVEKMVGLQARETIVGMIEKHL